MTDNFLKCHSELDSESVQIALTA